MIDSQKLLLFTLTASSVAASRMKETPRSANMRLTNEIRTGDIIALVLAFIGTVVLAACLTVALLRRWKSDTQTEKEIFVSDLDDDSIIKKDVSGKSELSTDINRAALQYEAVIGTLCATIVTLCLMYYFLNLEDD